MTFWLILGSIVLLFLMSTGAPIFVAFAMAGGLILIFHLGVPFEAIGQMFFNSVDNASLLAIPFFILAGHFMTLGGTSKRLIDVTNAFLGHLPGGMALSAVVAAAIFGTLSGSHAATAVAIGAMMIPQMTELGFERRFSSALICNSTTVGMLIPPSITAIIYGYATEMSVGKLFLAGVLPGLMVTVLCAILVLYISWRRGYPRSLRTGWKERGNVLKKAIPALLMPVIILGGIYTGVFTAMEAAGVATIYAIIAGLFIYKELTWTNFRHGVAQGIKSTANIYFLIASAMIFGKVFISLQIPQLMTQAAVSYGFGPLAFVFSATLLLLVLGTFMEVTAMMLVTLPIFWPTMVALEIDPYMFYVMMTLMVGIGQVTPPEGVVLYIMSDVSGEPVVSLFKESIMWLILLTVSSIIVILIPSMSSWLPSTM